MTNVLRMLSVLIVTIFFITEAANAQTTPMPAGPAMAPATALPHPAVPHAQGTPVPKACQKSNGCKKKKNKNKKKKQQAATQSPRPMVTPVTHQGMSPPPMSW